VTVWMQIQPAPVVALLRTVGGAYPRIRRLPRQLRQIPALLCRPPESTRGPIDALEAPAGRFLLTPVAGDMDGLVRQDVCRPRERLGMPPLLNGRARGHEKLQNGAFVRRQLHGPVKRITAPGALPKPLAAAPWIAPKPPVGGRPAPDDGVTSARKRVDRSRQGPIRVRRPPRRESVGVGRHRPRQECLCPEQHDKPKRADEGQPTTAAQASQRHAHVSRIGTQVRRSIP